MVPSKGRPDRQSRILTVLYDADCGFCAWTARILLRLDDRDRLRFVPLATAALPEQPALDVLAESLHVVDGNGSWATGADAVLEICRRVRWLRPFTLVRFVPGGLWLLDRGYRLVARNRQRISRALGLTECRLA